MKKTIVSLTAEREGSKLNLKIKIDKKIEALYKSMSNEAIETSTLWTDNEGNGLKFYKLNESMDAIRRSTSNRYSLCDNFGRGLVRDGYNIAIFRIVGASKGITFNVSSLVTYEELKSYIEALGFVVKDMYKNFITKQKISAKITFEL